MLANALLQSISIPDLWQQQAVKALREGNDVVVHAPTGAGKTFIFELLYSSLKGQAVFTVPTRALANDKLAEWKKRGWDVGIATGDLAEGLDRRVVVATLETQRARLLAGTGPRLLVIDEYQMLSDPVRGVHYELAIALAPESTQLLLLSGSVANPADIVAWLARIGRKAVLVSHAERPVPLEEVDLPSLSDHSPASLRAWWPRMIRNALAEDLGPVLLFAPRRKSAEQLAVDIAATLPPCQPLQLSDAQVQLAGRNLAKLLRLRVAYHHSGLSFAQRAQLVEPLAKAGQLRVVVATMGLAAGINFSMRSVAVSGTTYLVGAFERKVNAAELLQMFGRAGRRGLDDTGYALVAQHPPRLSDAQPLPLRRSNLLDWTTLLAVMHHASLRRLSAFESAIRLNARLFSPVTVPIGCEHSLATGTTPCGLFVDSERPRFFRRGRLQMWGSRNEWERQPVVEQLPLSECWVWLPESNAQDSELPTGRWMRAESVASVMQRFGKGPLCRLPGSQKRYGRELHLGQRNAEGTLELSTKLRQAFGRRNVSVEELESVVLKKLPDVTDGGIPVTLLPRGEQLFVQLSYGDMPLKAYRDDLGRALSDPPSRRSEPHECAGCVQREWCANVSITKSAAMAWRELGLIEPDGSPTRRGIIASFFQHGEGLAIAAALEDPTYSVDDLVFDIADLRGGPRFADEDAQAAGRLAGVCQRTFRNADHDGYLRMGIPSDYGAGASEVVRAIEQLEVPKQHWLSETLRMGDIERALLEWRSLLRHIAHAPEYEWERWMQLKERAKQLLEPQL